MATTLKERSSTSIEEAGQAAARVVETLSGASAEAGERLTELAGGAGEAVLEAERTLRGSSDQTLTILGAFSVGLAAGTLVAGAHRLIVIASLLPALLIAVAVLDRRSRGARGGRRTT